MPSDEPTKKSEGAQKSQGDEVPPELQGSGKATTSTAGTKPGDEQTDQVSYGEGEKNVKSGNLAS